MIIQVLAFGVFLIHFINILQADLPAPLPAKAIVVAEAEGDLLQGTGNRGIHQSPVVVVLPSSVHQFACGVWIYDHLKGFIYQYPEIVVTPE